MRACLLALLFWLTAGAAAAHKSSDAYLRLTVEPDAVAGSVDVALRDLELAIGLDGDGDGALTWGEVKSRHAGIAAYLAERLTFARGGSACPLRVTEHLIDRHTDGAYAVARFAVDCPGQGPLTLRYTLLFDRDPTHRGLLSIAAGGGVSSAVLSPEVPEAVVDTARPPASGFLAFLALGFGHISHGFDHLLFLLVVLLPALRPEPRVGRTAVEVVKILTAFTLAHGLSLALAVLGVVDLPSRLVETAIAATIVLTAIDNLWPFLPGRRWQIAFAFGLIHGLGFASALGPVNLPPLALATALLGFNLGIEAGQIAVALPFLAALHPLRRIAFFGRGLLPAGSLAAAALAGLWLVDRALALGVAPF